MISSCLRQPDPQKFCQKLESDYPPSFSFSMTAGDQHNKKQVKYRVLSKKWADNMEKERELVFFKYSRP